jgi:hypothetical protein
MTNVKNNSKVKKAGSTKSHEPRLVGSIVRDMLQVWNTNTALCVDLKTLLRSDLAMKAGKEYQGVLRRDVDIDDFRYDEHYTFVETLPWLTKRNPRVFRGKYITVTRRSDGSLRLNFRPVKMDESFNFERFALGVYNEICMALGGLIEIR